MCRKKEKNLTMELKAAERSGINLFLEGQPATPEDIARRCVCEDIVYMADYVIGENGRLQELRYDRVTDWK